MPGEIASLASGTYKAFAELSAIKEGDGVPQAKEMGEILTRDHEQVVKTCRGALIICQDAGDESSAALISDRMRIDEKTAWIKAQRDGYGVFRFRWIRCA